MSCAIARAPVEPVMPGELFNDGSPAGLCLRVSPYQRPVLWTREGQISLENSMKFSAT